MSIKCLLVLLGVTAALFCVANADVTLSNCGLPADQEKVAVASLAINPGGYIPLSGGDRTFSGSITITDGNSVSQVKVKVVYATASIMFLSLNLCDRDELSALCSSVGQDVTCTGFETLLGVSGVCDSSGNFQTSTDPITSPTITIPSVSTLSLSGTVSAKIKIIVGGVTVGCTTLSIPIHN